MKGFCKWFDDSRCFGFISGNDHKDYFVHHSEIKVKGFKTLIEGEPVEFEESKNEKGLLAKDVKKIEE